MATKGRTYKPMTEDQTEKSTSIWIDKELESIFLKETKEFGVSMREVVAEAVKAYHLSFEARMDQRKKDELKNIKKLRKKTEAQIKKLEMEKAALLLQLQELVV